ncbi:hypothetical protein IE53DRAFT_389826 [Violaceomyces palustris]|uniref:Uncharacterized protein n=1 Tax=Violaceomyces palustris TaxID=1673888 RepID=A0ACD0NQC7_9BASI|nr:hypothetical protein IE53DRAFT_389826 [Violaceomyces palustris]
MASTHSPQKIKLCEEIVLQHFGPLASRVASFLLKRGRLSVKDLVRFLNQSPSRSTKVSRQLCSSNNLDASNTTSSSDPSTSLAGPSLHGADPNAPNPIPKRLVQQTVLTLLQHGCLWHSSVDPRSQEVQEEYFEINPDEILSRLRFGRYIGYAEEFIGQDAAAIVSLVLRNGKMQASDIVTEMMKQSFPESQTAAELVSLKIAKRTDAASTKKRKAPDTEEELRCHDIQRELTRLLYRTYLKPSTLSQHISPRDKEISYEMQMRRSRKGIPTPKDLKEIREQVRIKIAEEREKDWEGEDGKNAEVSTTVLGQSRRGLRKATQIYTSSTKSKRSKGNSSSSSSKRKEKESSSSSSSTEFDPADDWEIELDVWLRVHYDRFDVHARNELMAEAVRSKYNSTAAEVFRNLIDAGEANNTRQSVRDERSSPISLTLLAPKLPQSLALPKGFDKRAFTNGGRDKSSSSGPTRQELLAEYCSVLSHSEDISSRAKSIRFVAPSGDGTTRSAGGAKVSSSFTVEYRNTAERMRRDVLRNVVEEKFGTSAVRIMGILREKGKLEEKHIAKLALISMGETRDICSRLFASSLLGLQEVPKSAERDPKKTFFLYYVDEAKCRAWLLDRLYQTLCRLGERRREETRRQSGLLRKVERSDVKMDTAGLLSEWEKSNWERLEKVLKTLTAAEARVDMDVFVMRDLACGVYSSE